LSNIFKRNNQYLNCCQIGTIVLKLVYSYSTKGTDDEYDDREQNYVYTNLNPQTILGYVRDFSPTIWFGKTMDCPRLELKKYYVMTNMRIGLEIAIK
jgi:hypothetical protein